MHASVPQAMISQVKISENIVITSSYRILRKAFLYSSKTPGEGADSLEPGVSIFSGTLKNHIQIRTAILYDTIWVTSHKNLNLVPKSENFVVANKDTVP